MEQLKLELHISEFILRFGCMTTWPELSTRTYIYDLVSNVQSEPNHWVRAGAGAVLRGPLKFTTFSGFFFLFWIDELRAMIE